MVSQAELRNFALAKRGAIKERRPQHRWIGHDGPASETLHGSGRFMSLLNHYSG